MSASASPTDSPPAEATTGRSSAGGRRSHYRGRARHYTNESRRRENTSTAPASISHADTPPTPTDGIAEETQANGRPRGHRDARPPQDPYSELLALLCRTQDGLADVTSNLDASKDAVRRLSGDRRALQDAQRELKQAHQTIAELERALAHVQHEKQEVGELLERRTTELNAAQVFFPSSETVTDTQVADLVKDLNYEISQVATALVESYEGRTRHTPPDSVATFCTQQLGGALGDAVVQILTPGKAASGDADFFTWFQIALEGCVGWVVRDVSVRWCLGPRKDMDVFDEVWRALQRSESAQVAIKWSTITRKYAHQALDWKRVDEYVGHFVAERVADVIVLSGFEPDVENRETAATLVLSKVGRQIMEVARLAVQLNETIGQKFPSYILEPLLVSPGASFDPSTMASEFNDERAGVLEEDTDTASWVMCTTELGLRRVAEGGNSHTILVKPKVVLGKQH